MPNQLDADARVKMALGTQFVEIQILQDQLAAAQQQLAAKDAEIATLKSQEKASP